MFEFGNFHYNVVCFLLLVFASSYNASKPKCGISRVPSSRIIGGSNSLQGAWPWHAGIVFRNTVFCGGTIVDPTTIITAAHCVEYTTPAMIAVKVGGHNLSYPINEQTLNVSSYKIHEKYKTIDYPYDIAIIKLKAPIKFNKYVQPICFPDVNETISDGDFCYVTGWGYNTIHENQQPTILQQLKLQIINNTACHTKNQYFANITQDMVCAVKLDQHSVTNRLICGGDSGGPLVCKDTASRRKGVWKLHGVVNWASPVCHSKLSYSVFARISHHRDWIKANV